MDRFTQIIGLEKCGLLRAYFGGQSLFIPKTLKIDHPLIKVIGLDAAIKLCNEASGLVYIRTPHKNIRNESIKKDRANGMTLRQLAVAYGLSIPRIQTIVKIL